MISRFDMRCIELAREEHKRKQKEMNEPYLTSDKVKLLSEVTEQYLIWKELVTRVEALMQDENDALMSKHNEEVNEWRIAKLKWLLEQSANNRKTVNSYLKNYGKGTSILGCFGLMRVKRLNDIDTEMFDVSRPSMPRIIEVRSKVQTEKLFKSLIRVCQLASSETISLYKSEFDAVFNFEENFPDDYLEKAKESA